MSLYLVMTQASRYLRDQSLNMREKQLLKRELNAELVRVKSVILLAYYLEDIRILSQLLIFVEKSVLYAKITLSQISFKQTTCLSFSWFQ